MAANGNAASNGEPRIILVVHQAVGVLMQRDGTTSEEASAALHAQAEASGRDVVDVAAEIVRSTTDGS